MISGITGELLRVDEGRCSVAVSGVVLEVLVPACDAAELETQRGHSVTLHTLVYLEGDPTRGNLAPRMIGFLRPGDRAFFELFTTVKGIGNRTALRALSVPVEQIASAIESKDARALMQLDGVGKRTAELIIAELSGKVGRFVGSMAPTSPRGPVASSRRSPEEEDALAALAALGESRYNAEQLLERVKAGRSDLVRADQLIREMLKMRG